MTTSHGAHFGGRFHWSAGASSATAADSAERVGAMEAAIAALRIGTGFIFLWAFFDKTFGWNYATPSSKAWIHGGSPTKGFLSHVEVGPFQSTFHSWAGKGVIDWLFMLGLLGIGMALVLGIGLRIAAVAGVLLVALMWFAVYPPARYTAAGTATGSNNPFVDDHVIEALALVTVAVFGTGSRLGLGAVWAKLPFVARHRSLI